MSVELHKGNYFEVLWYDVNGKVYAEEFQRRNQAMKFYEQHKCDDDKFAFWVTKRDKDDNVLEDIVY